MRTRPRFLVALVLTLFIGASTYARNNTGGAAIVAPTGTPSNHISRPSVGRTGTEPARSVGNVSVDLTNGLTINDGLLVPSGQASTTTRRSIQRGVSNAPVPRFGGINAPVWLTDQNGFSVQILNDMILHGLTEVRGGLTSNSPVTVVAPPPPPPPPADCQNLHITPASIDLALGVDQTFTAQATPGTFTGTISWEHTQNQGQRVGSRITTTGATSSVNITGMNATSYLIVTAFPDDDDSCVQFVRVVQQRATLAITRLDTTQGTAFPAPSGSNTTVPNQPILQFRAVAARNTASINSLTIRRTPESSQTVVIPSFALKQGATVVGTYDASSLPPTSPITFLVNRRLNSGQTEDFTVEATIPCSSRTERVDYRIENVADINTNAAVMLTPSPLIEVLKTVPACPLQRLTVSVDESTSVTRNISPGERNVPVVSLNFRTETPIKVEQFNVRAFNIINGTFRPFTGTDVIRAHLVVGGTVVQTAVPGLIGLDDGLFAFTSSSLSPARDNLFQVSPSQSQTVSIHLDFGANIAPGPLYAGIYFRTFETAQGRGRENTAFIATDNSGGTITYNRDNAWVDLGGGNYAPSSRRLLLSPLVNRYPATSGYFYTLQGNVMNVIAPDLAVQTPAMVPANPFVNTNLVFSAAVTNLARATAAATTTTFRILNSRSQEVTGSAQTAQTGVLSANAAETETFRWTPSTPAVLPGQYFFEICADNVGGDPVYHAVQEADDSYASNCTIRPFQLNASSITFSRLPDDPLAALTGTQQTLIGAPLLKFRATALQRDITLHYLSFRKRSTRQEITFPLANFALYDGNTLLGTLTGRPAGRTPNANVTFSNINLPIPAGTSKDLILRADLPCASNTQTIDYALDDVTDDVQATGADIKQINPLFISSPKTLPTCPVILNPTLSVDSDPSFNSAQLFQSGARLVDVAKVRFTAANGPFSLQSLRFTSQGRVLGGITDLGGGQFSSPSPIQRLYLYDGTQQINGNWDGVNLDVTGSPTIATVPSNGQKILTLKADIKSIDRYVRPLSASGYPANWCLNDVNGNSRYDLGEVIWVDRTSPQTCNTNGQGNVILRTDYDSSGAASNIQGDRPVTMRLDPTTGDFIGFGFSEYSTHTLSGSQLQISGRLPDMSSIGYFEINGNSTFDTGNTGSFAIDFEPLVTTRAGTNIASASSADLEDISWILGGSGRLGFGTLIPQQPFYAGLHYNPGAYTATHFTAVGTSASGQTITLSEPTNQQVNSGNPNVPNGLTLSLIRQNAAQMLRRSGYIGQIQGIQPGSQVLLTIERRTFNEDRTFTRGSPVAAPFYIFRARTDSGNASLSGVTIDLPGTDSNLAGTFTLEKWSPGTNWRAIANASVTQRTMGDMQQLVVSMPNQTIDTTASDFRVVALFPCTETNSGFIALISGISSITATSPGGNLTVTVNETSSHSAKTTLPCPALTVTRLDTGAAAIAAPAPGSTVSAAAPLLRFQLAATGSDIVVNSITVRRSTGASSSAVRSLVLHQDGQGTLHIANPDPASVDATSGAAVIFTLIPGYTIRPGEPQPFTLKGDVSCGSGTTDYYISANSDVALTTQPGLVTVSPSPLPIRLKSVAACPQPSRLTITRLDTNPITIPTPSRGQTSVPNQPIFRFDVAATGVPIIFRSVTVRPAPGSNSDALRSLSLYQDSQGTTQIATPASPSLIFRSTTSRTFDLISNYTITPGQSQAFTLYADVNCASGNFDWYIDRVNDVTIGTANASVAVSPVPLATVMKTTPSCPPLGGRGGPTVLSSRCINNFDDDCDFIGSSFQEEIWERYASENCEVGDIDDYGTRREWCRHKCSLVPTNNCGANYGNHANYGHCQVSGGSCVTHRDWTYLTPSQRFERTALDPNINFSSVSQASVLTLDREAPLSVAGALAEPALALSPSTPQITAPPPVHPLNIFDDVVVSGAGASEPGNVVVEGTRYGGRLYTNRLLVIGTVTQDLIVTGALNAGGGTSTSPHTLSGDTRILGGTLTVTGRSQLGNLPNGVTIGTPSPGANADLVVKGRVTGTTSIGRIYETGSNNVSVRTQTWGPPSTASCNPLDTLISCSADYGTPAPASGTVWVPEYQQNSCAIRARWTTQPSDSFTVRAKATCFSPDG